MNSMFFKLKYEYIQNNFSKIYPFCTTLFLSQQIPSSLVPNERRDKKTSISRIFKKRVKEKE